MILKVHQHSTDKWFLFDNIVLAKIQRYISVPDQPHDPELFVNLLPETPLGSKDYAVLVDLNFKEGASKTVICQGGNAYLMNDDGKTIERL